MLLLKTAFQQLHIALYFESAHHRTFRCKCSFVLKMDLTVYIQLIFLCVLNIIFTFSGIFLNTLVIASFWKSSHLRKKLCHFMIMVLSISDLVAVVTNNTGLLLYLISLLREDYDFLPSWTLYLQFVSVFTAFSSYVLLVMSIERYLGAYYPIFHRTSVTRLKLLTLLAIILIFHTTLRIISINDMIISNAHFSIIFVTVFFPPMVFINFKLFKISREVRRRKTASPEKRTTINLKSISTCLLVVACLVVLSIPSSVYIVFNISTENNQSSNARLSYIWATTAFTMNCTFNSIIFFWKNNVLRTEGIKIQKSLKDLLVGS